MQLIYKDIKKIQIISPSYIFQVKETKHFHSLKATDDQSTAPHPYQDGLKALWRCEVLENTLGCSIIGVAIQSSRQYTLDKDIN